jgi:sulfite exporter TauE/SafE
METVNILLYTAAITGFFHALVGPDHYLPFIFIGKSRSWTLRKTLSLTFLCGLGHLVSSIVISTIGLALGYAITQIEFFDHVRADLAAWLFTLFGLGYMIWGIVQANKKTNIEHAHDGDRAITPWVLFIIFALGPCEILIPQVMLPAANHNLAAAASVVFVFSLFTIAAMCLAVTAGYYGFKLINTKKIERYMHAITGAILLVSGLIMLLFHAH